MLGKAQHSADFKHLLWRRHPDPAWWDSSRPEILATDGRIVRRLTSQHQHIAYQAFQDTDAATDIASKIEASVAEGVALMGYSMFAQHDAVAILHTADGLAPGWVAFPHKRTSSSTVPTLPLHVAEMPKLRLVGGAELKWSGGELLIDAVLEQRGDRFAKGPFAFNILEHVQTWELRGQVRSVDGAARPLRLVRRDADSEIRRAHDLRLAARFPIDTAIWREFESDSSLEIWFVVAFDRELLCLPDDWLRFWMQVELVR